MNNESVYTIKSDHYTFFSHQDELAQKNISSIIELQESCYQKIANKIDHTFNKNIHFHVLTSPYEVGEQYLRLRNEPPNKTYKVNAFAWYPNKVYCTYNQDIKSIGSHEVAHLMLFDLFQDLGHIFLNEGFAVSIDEYWLGLDASKWTKHLLERNILNDIDQLFSNNTFYEVTSIISYPVAGSFVQWLVTNESMSTFRRLYQASITENIERELKDRKNEYVSYIRKVKLSDHDMKYIEDLLRHFGIENDGKPSPQLDSPL